MPEFKITDFMSVAKFPQIGEIICSAIVKNTGSSDELFACSILDLETGMVLGSGTSKGLILAGGIVTVDMVVTEALTTKGYYPLRFAVGYVNGSGSMVITDYKDFTLGEPTPPEAPPEGEVTPLQKYMPVLVISSLLLGGILLIYLSSKKKKD